MGSREISKRFDPLETSNLSLLKKAMTQAVTRLNLDGHRFMPMGDTENVFIIQYMCVFCFDYHVP